MQRQEETAEARTRRHAGARVTAHALAAAFVTYLCMYGLRKPFTAGAFGGEVGTALFAISLTDALGYLGAVLVLLAKPWIAESLSRYEFFCALSYATSAIGLLGFALSARAFARRLAADR